MDTGWHAYVEDTSAGWMMNTVRLHVAFVRRDGADVLNPDGTVTFHEAAIALPEDSGFVIPRGAVEAIAAAIQRWQGDAGHAATEARVLREWLTEERRRVDAILRTPLTSPEEAP